MCFCIDDKMSRVAITREHSKQDLQYTQKTIYSPIFAKNIWSYLLWSPVLTWSVACGGAILLCRRSKRYQHIDVVDYDGGGNFNLASIQVKSRVRVYVVHEMHLMFGCGGSCHVSALGAVVDGHTFGCAPCRGVRVRRILRFERKHTHCVRRSFFVVCFLVAAVHANSASRGADCTRYCSDSAIVLRLLAWRLNYDRYCFFIELISLFFLNERIWYLVRGLVLPGSQSRPHFFYGQARAEFCFVVQLLRIDWNALVESSQCFPRSGIPCNHYECGHRLLLCTSMCFFFA